VAARIGRRRRLSPHGLDQLELRPARQALDARLLAQGRRAVGHRERGGELDRPARARVAAGGSRLVLGEASLDVRRPAAVEAVVGAAEQVDGCHPHRFAGPAVVPC